jgi:hypothetical protein
MHGHKMPLLIAFAVALAAVLAGCGSTPPIHTDGQLEVFASPLNGQSAQTAYPGITPGTQVIVVNSSGKVIGTGSLTYNAAAVQAADKQFAAALPGTPASMYSTWIEAFGFTATVPGGQPRYGIQVSGQPGTVWFTPAEMRKGPVLSLGSMG